MCEMVHQPDEEWQVGARDPLLVERQDEVAVLGGQQVIRVLDPFGDALAGQHRADVVERDEGAEFGVADFGINRHRPILPARLSCRPRLVP